jgi:hypothetical protein
VVTILSVTVNDEDIDKMINGEPFLFYLETNEMVDSNLGDTSKIILPYISRYMETLLDKYKRMTDADRYIAMTNDSINKNINFRLECDKKND